MAWNFVVPDFHTSDGWTKFVKTMFAHPSTYGEMLSDEVILEQHNGSSQLHNDNEDVKSMYVLPTLRLSSIAS